MTDQTDQTDQSDAQTLRNRLLAACNGHPYAKIAWPHNLLHDSVNALDAAQAEIARLRGQVEAADALVANLVEMDDGWRQCGCDRCLGHHVERDMVLDALAEEIAAYRAALAQETRP